MNQFDIEFQWNKYLEFSELRIDVLPVEHVREIKRAFMAGLAQMYLLLVNGTVGIDDDMAIQGVNEIRDQLSCSGKQKIILNNHFD